MNKIILLLIVLSCAFWQCQPTKTLTTNKVALTNFPIDWVGEWEGRLEIFNVKGKSMDLYMGLNILPLENDRYTWTIIYGEGEKRQERKYELMPKDTAKGHYLIDEKNSIILDDFLLGNTLYSRFEVMENLLLTSYKLEGEILTFEVISGNLEPINATGGQDSIPVVNSYNVFVMQRAELKRKSKK